MPNGKAIFFSAIRRQAAERNRMNDRFYGGCDPPIPWIGGKTMLLPVIKRIIPEYPKKFVDVFGGGGSVSLSGRIAPVQIYNDYNFHLVNFMRVTKTRADDLVNKLMGAFNSDGSLNEDLRRRFFINSRDFFNIASHVFYKGEEWEGLYDANLKTLSKASTLREKQHAQWLADTAWEAYREYNRDSELMDAVFFYILMKCSYSATGTSWACKPVNYDSIVRLINEANRMLQCIIIENKDCIDLIKLHDGQGTFIYCDPPYYLAEDLYNSIAPFKDDKHKELHDTLLQCESKVLISYNECDFIDKLYCEDKWYKMRLSRPHNMVLHNGAGALYNEFLIANYDIFELYSYGRQTTFFDELNDLNEEGRLIL